VSRGILRVFDDPRLRESEALSFRAEQARDKGDHPGACALYAQAAEGAEAVARAVPLSLPRTRGLLARSAVALLYKGCKYAEAVMLADHFLADEGADPGFRREIEGLRGKCAALR